MNIDIGNQNQNTTMVEMFIRLLLAINKKFMLPGENLILEFINNPDTISNRKFLSESIVNLFNIDRNICTFRMTLHIKYFIKKCNCRGSFAQLSDSYQRISIKHEF